MPAVIDSTMSSSLSSSSSSSWALTYYVVAIATSLVVPPPLSLCRRLYRHANACLIAPLSHQQLVVTLSPLSPRQCFSWPAPLSLRRRLSCGASLAPAGCRFANYLDVPLSLVPRRMAVALLPLSLRRSLSLRHLSH